MLRSLYRNYRKNKWEEIVFLLFLKCVRNTIYCIVMAYNFKDLKQKIEDTGAWLTEEYFSIRTSRATPALLDSVRVEAYGSKMALNQTATISVEDARLLRVSPYDVTLSKEIERAIAQSNLGVSVGVDDRGIRVSFPELTTERRAQLLKLVGDKLEGARISVRKLREEVWEDIQEKEREKDISEDEKFQAKIEMQKLIAAGNRKLEEIAEKKERELNQ